MSITGIGGVAQLGKLDSDTAVKSNDSNRMDQKFVNKALGQPDGADQRIESRIAAVKQQVGATTDTSDSNEGQSVSKKANLDNKLSYALTQQAIHGEDSSEGNRENADDHSSESNRQTRAQSARAVDSPDVSLHKTSIEF